MKRLTMRGRARVRTAAFHVFVALTSFAMIYPILWLAANSFKGSAELWQKVYSLIPQNFTLENYRNGWKGFGGISFSIFFRNSIVYASVATVLAVVSSALVAFGFARIEFRGRNLLFACMLATLMIPPQIQIIPQYVLFAKIGLVNTLYPLILPRLFGQAFFIFMFVQFIRGIPRELDEAAAIDGANRLEVFGLVLIPLLKPALFTGSIFSFYWTWGEFLQPLVYLNAPKLYTLSIALRSFSDPSGMTDWGAIYAMSTLSLLPVFIIFIAFQRYLVQGIATTGLKG
jgi:multiple sugar transport system permease protein